MVVFGNQERQETGLPVLAEEGETLLHIYPKVSLVIGNESRGVGTVHLGSVNLYWLNDTDTSIGYRIPFRSIALHAVMKDESATPQPCIYCQLDTGEDDAEMRSGLHMGSGLPEHDDEEEEEEEEEEAEGGEEKGESGEENYEWNELRFVPQDAGIVQTMFVGFSEVAALNPDDEEEGTGDFFFDADSMVTAGGAAASSVLAHLESVMHVDGAFDDAEEEGEGESRSMDSESK